MPVRAGTSSNADRAIEFPTRGHISPAFCRSPHIMQPFCPFAPAMSIQRSHVVREMLPGLKYSILT
eukprot:3855028-Lingulodinium_polyedra.AAC.1